MVSIIVPVYNTGEYLRSCVESILEQTYVDIELIVVDDGSEVVTASLCDELSMQDNRIKVIHTSNGGVSRARNIGLANAKGEIISFVDSDDTIHPKMIETMVEALERDNSQIAVCDAMTIIPGETDTLDTLPDYNKSCIVVSRDLSSYTLARLAGSVWRCIYKRTLLIKTQASFPIGLKFSEDRIYNIMAMSGSNMISYVKEPLYNRLIRAGSACYRYYPDMLEQWKKLRQTMLPIVRKYWGEDYIGAYELQLSGHIMTMVNNYTSFYCNEPILRQLYSLQNLCESEEVKECLLKSRRSNLRAKLIIKDRYISLFLLGVLINIKHKLCRQGLYQG